MKSKNLVLIGAVCASAIYSQLCASAGDNAKDAAEETVKNLVKDYDQHWEEISMNRSEDPTRYHEAKALFTALKQQFTKDVKDLPTVQTARLALKDNEWMPIQHYYYDKSLERLIEAYEGLLEIIGGPNTQRKIKLYKPAADKAAREIVAKYAKQKAKLETALVDDSAEKDLTPDAKELQNMLKRVNSEIEATPAIMIPATERPLSYVATEGFQTQLEGLREKFINKFYEKLTKFVESSDVSDKSLNAHSKELNALESLVKQKRETKFYTTRFSLDYTGDSQKAAENARSREEEMLSDKVQKLQEQFKAKLREDSEPTSAPAASAGEPAAPSAPEAPPSAGAESEPQRLAAIAAALEERIEISKVPGEHELSAVKKAPAPTPASSASSGGEPSSTEKKPELTSEQEVEKFLSNIGLNPESLKEHSEDQETLKKKLNAVISKINLLKQNQVAFTAVKHWLKEDVQGFHSGVPVRRQYDEFVRLAEADTTAPVAPAASSSSSASSGGEPDEHAHAVLMRRNLADRAEELDERMRAAIDRAQLLPNLAKVFSDYSAAITALQPECTKCAAEAVCIELHHALSRRYNTRKDALRKDLPERFEREITDYGVNTINAYIAAPATETLVRLSSAASTEGTEIERRINENKKVLTAEAFAGLNNSLKEARLAIAKAYNRRSAELGRPAR